MGLIDRKEVIESILHEAPMLDNEILQEMYNIILPKIKYRWDSDAFWGVNK